MGFVVFLTPFGWAVPKKRSIWDEPLEPFGEKTGHPVGENGLLRGSCERESNFVAPHISVSPEYAAEALFLSLFWGRCVGYWLVPLVKRFRNIFSCLGGTAAAGAPLNRFGINRLCIDEAF